MQSSFRNLRGRDLLLLTIVGLALVGVLWYYLFYSNTKAQIDAARQDLDLQSQQLTIARQKVARLPALQTEVAELRVTRDELLRALPATAEMGRVLEEIRGNLLASGADLLGISRSDARTTETLPAGVQPIGITLNVTGTFNALYSTLRSLENMNRFSTINSLQLNLGSADDAGGTTDPTLAGTMGLTVYTFDPGAARTPPGGTPGAPAAPDAPAPAAPPAGGTP